MRNIFDEARSKPSVRPVSQAAGAVNGAAVDAKGYDSGLAIVEMGVATGSPTAQTVDAKIQESADGSTGWADVSGASITQQTADDKSAQIRVDDLENSRQRYLRLVITVGFTGGSTPAIPIVGNIVLGRAENIPVGNTSAGE